MEVNIIRGYKLKLWRDRLNLAPEFVSKLDLAAKNLIHMEIPDEEEGRTTFILLTKVKGSKIPIPVKITMSDEFATSLIEKVEINVESK